MEDGDVITAGAVSASIDLGLYICQKWAGKEAAKEIRSRMAYAGWDFSWFLPVKIECDARSWEIWVANENQSTYYEQLKISFSREELNSSLEKAGF